MLKVTELWRRLILVLMMVDGFADARVLSVDAPAKKSRFDVATAPVICAPVMLMVALPSVWFCPPPPVVAT